jgi:predicted aspartyl protease
MINPLQGQIIGLDILGKNTVAILPFKLVQGHIVIEVKMHGHIPSRFIFDTGAQHTILFDKDIIELFGYKSDRSIKLTGADMSDTLYADIVRNVYIKLDETELVKRDVVVLPSNFLKLQNLLGIDILGLIGSDFYKNLIVKIDYEKEKITFFNPGLFKQKELSGFVKIPSHFIENKAYIDANSSLSSPSKDKSLRLLLDTGASLPLLINTTADSSIQKPSFVFNTILGIGLTGPIMGFKGKINKLEIQNYDINNTVAYFQDDVDLGEDFKERRNGLIGNVTLSKFTIIIDYFRKQIYFKANKRFDEPIEYDLSGMSIHAYGPEFHQFIIREVIKNSPSDLAGLQVYDEIIKIGRTKAKHFTLDEITDKMTAKPGKKIKFTVRRGEDILVKELILKDYLSGK